jgi:hypothetical protein
MRVGVCGREDSSPHGSQEAARKREREMDGP